MTYKDLMLLIQVMDKESQEQDVTVCVEDEYYQAELRICQETDVLDEGHYYLEAI